MKQIQISEQLFRDIFMYIVLDQDDTKAACIKGLEDKLESLVKRDLYTKYKTSATAAQREKARQEYLKHIGVTDDFRW